MVLLLGLTFVVNLFLGGREARRYFEGSRDLRGVSEEQLFRMSLITLSDQPDVDFLREVRSRVGESTVYLQVASDRCAFPGQLLNSGDTYGVAYALLPARVTCDKSEADFALYFRLRPPAEEGVAVLQADDTHVLLRLKGS